MGSRTLQPDDPEAKPYEDLRKEIEEHDRRVKAARVHKPAPQLEESEEKQ